MTTTPFQNPEPEKKPKAMYIIIGVLALLVLVLAFLILKGKPATKHESPQMKQMAETVQKIQGLESDVQEKQNEIFSLMRDYKTQTGKDLGGISTMNLTPEQQTVLEAKIKDEQNVSIKSLLQDILNRNKEIGDLKNQITQIEALLPKAHTVEKGENHYQVAMSFLVEEKGLDKKKAAELVEKAALFEPLVPGFKVWNFFDNEEYGTFVTQGSAAISPNSVQRKVKKELVDAKDQAIAEKDKLALDIQELEKRRAELIGQIDLLAQEKETMLIKLADLDKQNQDLQTTLSSVFYLADTKKNLEAKGVLKGGFLKSTKLQSVSPELFTHSLDLRADTKIVLSAPELSLTKIKRISVYPTFLKEGTDFTVAIDETRQSATITLLDTKKFQNERVVLSIE